MAVYEWGEKLNFLIDEQANAQTVGEEIDRIRQQHGGQFTPRALWVSQKAKRAKLHRYFEWDDKVAGAKYRDRQAGDLIRSLKVVYENDSGVESSVRAFSSIRNPDERSQSVYVDTVSAMSEDETRNEILEQAYNGLKSWRRRWSELNDCADSIALVDEAILAIRGRIEKWKP